MSKYYLDTKFNEYKKKPLFSKPIDTIELISIGIVAEDDREYYAISKEFDLKAAWNSYQLKQVDGDLRNRYPDGMKEYWLRNNVLKTLGYDITTFARFKAFINNVGKSNAQIAEEVIGFVTPTNEPQFCIDDFGNRDITYQATKRGGTLPEFYAYYADYDWVVFCWLFGRMIDLPKGFPMYCRDLKQMLDEKVISSRYLEVKNTSFESALKRLKNHSYYPLQSNEHNALNDAIFNKNLYNFIQKL